MTFSLCSLSLTGNVKDSPDAYRYPRLRCRRIRRRRYPRLRLGVLMMTQREWIEKKFRERYPTQPIEVIFHAEDESIQVNVEGEGDFICEAGSDDDDFYFEDPNTGDYVRFDFDDDWFNALPD